MEQHPIPRQITTFEFKLIGFMTLHQFIYLVVFIPLGFVVYKITPIPFVNILLGLIVGTFGILLAFLPINDRPLEVFVKNLFKRLTSPTQYAYKKTNKPLEFLGGGALHSDPVTVGNHVDSQEKLSQYLQSKTKSSPVVQTMAKRTVGVHDALVKSSDAKAVEDKQLETKYEEGATPLKKEILEAQVSAPSEAEQPKPERKSEQSPFFVGEVKNSKETPLPEILVYIKDKDNNPLRLLKTNPHGVFATFNPLPKGEYTVEAKDPRGSYLFDTMKIQLGDTNPAPFTVFSKGFL